MVEFIAVVRNERTKSGRTLEYLYFDGDDRITDSSRRIAMSQDTECVLLFYKTVMSREYEDCRKMVETGEATPNDITELLN